MPSLTPAPPVCLAASRRRATLTCSTRALPRLKPAQPGCWKGRAAPYHCPPRAQVPHGGQLRLFVYDDCRSNLPPPPPSTRPPHSPAPPPGRRRSLEEPAPQAQHPHRDESRNHAASCQESNPTGLLYLLWAQALHLLFPRTGTVSPKKSNWASTRPWRCAQRRPNRSTSCPATTTNATHPLPILCLGRSASTACHVTASRALLPPNALSPPFPPHATLEG